MEDYIGAWSSSHLPFSSIWFPHRYKYMLFLYSASQQDFFIRRFSLRTVKMLINRDVKAAEYDTRWRGIYFFLPWLSFGPVRPNVVQFGPVPLFAHSNTVSWINRCFFSINLINFWRFLLSHYHRPPTERRKWKSFSYVSSNKEKCSSLSFAKTLEHQMKHPNGKEKGWNFDFPMNNLSRNPIFSLWAAEFLCFIQLSRLLENPSGKTLDMVEDDPSEFRFPMHGHPETRRRCRMIPLSGREWFPGYSRGWIHWRNLNMTDKIISYSNTDKQYNLFKSIIRSINQSINRHRDEEKINQSINQSNKRQIEIQPTNQSIDRLVDEITW